MILFVYGTLKSGFSRNCILDGQKFVGIATTKPHYLLYDCGQFPAMIKSENGRSIVGELWEIKEDLVPYLDKIEGSPDLYKMDDIELISGQTVKCYLFQQDVREYNLKECGIEWLKGR